MAQHWRGCRIAASNNCAERVSTVSMQLDTLERIHEERHAGERSASALALNAPVATAAPGWKEDVDEGGDERMQGAQADDVSCMPPQTEVCILVVCRTKSMECVSCSCCLCILATMSVVSMIVI
jgi:hypothetical protein